MGFFKTLKKIFGKGNKKQKQGKKERKFYLESEEKKPSRETYEMSGIEEIGEMPERVPGPRESQGNRNKGLRERRETPRENRSRLEPSRRASERSRTKREENFPEFPEIRPRKRNLGNLGRRNERGSERVGRNQGTGDRRLNRIMDRLDDIESRLRSIERRLERF